MPVGEQIAVLYCGIKGLLKDLSLDQVDDFQTTFLSKMRAFHADDVLQPLSAGRVDDTVVAIIEKEASSIINGMMI
jgi:F-type H+-transporting ATPase subunit alpha